jgi:hypothetical protein
MAAEAALPALVSRGGTLTPSFRGIPGRPGLHEAHTTSAEETCTSAEETDKKRARTSAEETDKKRARRAPPALECVDRGRERTGVAALEVALGQLLARGARA